MTCMFMSAPLSPILCRQLREEALKMKFGWKGLKKRISTHVFKRTLTIYIHGGEEVQLSMLYQSCIGLIDKSKNCKSWFIDVNVCGFFVWFSLVLLYTRWKFIATTMQAKKIHYSWHIYQHLFAEDYIYFTLRQPQYSTN